MQISSDESCWFGTLTSSGAAHAAVRGAVLVLPVGAIEQHGAHLPLDTDAYLAVGWAVYGVRLAVEKYGVPAWVLPPLPYGCSHKHVAYPGTISLSFHALAAVVSEVLTGALKQGFRGLVIVNGNGGNQPALEEAAYSVKSEWPEARIFLVDHTLVPKQRRKALLARLVDDPDDIHAGGVETSEMLAERPGLVDLQGVVRPAVEIDPYEVRLMNEMSSTGASGNPASADAEVGRDLWEEHRQAMAELLNRIWSSLRRA